MSATQILQIAEWAIADRGKEYDSTKGERSGARVAAAFSAITGKRITAAAVYFLLQLVKDARQRDNRRGMRTTRKIIHRH